MNMVLTTDIVDERVSTLGRIFTGYYCNLRCTFCYYSETVDNVKYPSLDIIDQLVTCKVNNMTGVEFSGGESTLDVNFNTYIEYAKSLGFVRISTITNGCVYSNIDKLKSAIDSGLNDILISTSLTKNL